MQLRTRRIGDRVQPATVPTTAKLSRNVFESLYAELHEIKAGNERVPDDITSVAPSLALSAHHNNARRVKASSKVRYANTKEVEASADVAVRPRLLVRQCRSATMNRLYTRGKRRNETSRTKWCYRLRLRPPPTHLLSTRRQTAIQQMSVHAPVSKSLPTPQRRQVMLRDLPAPWRITIKHRCLGIKRARQALGGRDDDSTPVTAPLRTGEC